MDEVFVGQHRAMKLAPSATVHVILRSPPFLLADDEGSPQFAGDTRWLAFQRNCRDSSAPKEQGPQNDRGPEFGAGHE